jgi:outer membrane beta-barrel protein
LSLTTALWLPLPAAAATVAAGPPPKTDGAPKEEEDVVVLEDEMEGGGQPGGDKAASGELDSLLGGEDAKSAEAEAKAAAAGPEEGVGKAEKDSEAKQIKTESKLIRVVQRQRMLKRKRVDLQPQIGISVNDPYVRHYTFGAEISFWPTNRMALSLTGTGMVGARTPRYDNVKIQEGLLLTANKILWQAHLNYQYNPFYGKVAIFNRLLLHWEGYVQVGGGVMQTEVIPRFGALHDPFRNFTGGGQFTIGTRFYVPKVNWLSINLGARTWIYPDKLEPSNRGPDEDRGDDLTLDDPAAAKSEAKWTVQFNTTLFLGLSFYLPSSFEYSTPR